MGVIALVSKMVLVIVNLLLLLLSVAMMLVGIIVVAGKDIYNDMLTAKQSSLDQSVHDIGLNVDTNNLTFNDFLTPAAYALVAIGIVVGALALLGCIGGCYTIKIILLIYVIATTVIFIVQCAIVTAVYTDKSMFDATVKPYIKDTLEPYAGIEGTDAHSVAWNAIMNYEGCCGVDDYTDFQNLTNWPVTTINGNPAGVLVTPVICCKSKTEDYSCAQTPSDSVNYWNTGCYDKMFDLILDNSLVITVIAFLIASQLVLIIFTILILCNDKIDIV